ncbi:MAG: diguanylate cyclase [Dactylosporangium sp.]|nr:GGDEF domain-containing protein [Dactylosporangium sp.]NNJ62119.1 diguanylate cyclase [Dactylosporangium sp.]
MVQSGRGGFVRALFRRGSARLVPAALNLVVQRTSDAVVVVAPDGRFLHLNPAGYRLVRQLVPDAPAELIGRSAPEVLGPRLPEEPLASGEYDLTIGGRDRTLGLRVTRLLDRKRRPAGLVFVIRDVTSLTEASARLVEQESTFHRLRTELEHQAIHDPLTGLHNRRYLVERLADEVKRAQQGSNLSIIMLDIDNFKGVNESHGHAAGDDLLAAVARGLIDTVRSRDVLARYGGVEFVVVLPGAASRQACARAEQLRRRCAAVGVETADGPIARTVSAGVATFPGAGRTPSALLSSADQALHVAKSTGRDRVSLAEHTYVGGL